MDCGAESATDSSIGVQTTPELCVISWGFLLKVRKLIHHLMWVVILYLTCCKKDARVVEGELARMFWVSERAPLLGEVHCIGTETELLECSHTSIGRHSCGVTVVPPVPDIVITCSGMTEVVLCTLLLCCIKLFGKYSKCIGTT